MKKEKGKIILITGSKGGCGKSFIANNIASCYAKTSNKNILLMDLNFGRKDSRIIFKASEENIKTVNDIGSRDVNEEILKKLIFNFDNSLNVIFPPISFNDSNHFSWKANLKAASALKKYFDFIIIDTEIDMNDYESCIFLSNIDKLIIVSLPDLISLTNLNLIVNLSIFYTDYINTSIVINKFNIKPSVPFSLLNSIVKNPIDYFIPYDRDIEQLYLTKGPSEIFKYNLRIIRDINNMAKNLIEELV